MQEMRKAGRGTQQYVQVQRHMAPLPTSQSRSAAAQPRTIKKHANNGNREAGKKKGNKRSTRIAPIIEEAGPQLAKKQTLRGPSLQVQGPMIDMQIRNRGEEAKRKNIDAVNIANKKRCERDENIAIVELKAYWDLFPLPAKEERAKSTPAPDSDDDELIEDSKLGNDGNLRPGMRLNDQELIEEVATYKDKSCSRMAARNARLELRKTLQTSIEDKQEADAKKRKLEPPNSREGQIRVLSIGTLIKHIRILCKQEFNTGKCGAIPKGAACSMVPRKGVKLPNGRYKRSLTSAVRSCPDLRFRMPNLKCNQCD